ncbi:MAG: hypothetical protein RLZZ628_1056 [Bacteroidota bacterium]|jgi:outer membrane receptor protein involved in Fe transport
MTFILSKNTYYFYNAKSWSVYFNFIFNSIFSQFMKKTKQQFRFWQKMLPICTFLLLCSSFITAQRVAGKVNSKNGEPLIGASVLVKGTTNGAITNGDGAFAIENVAKGSTLVASFIGHQTREVAAEGTNITIVLEESSSLEEVVVTGVFDKRTRMQSSVAISTLNSKQIEQIAIGSAADLLKNIPGVFVNSSLGEIRNTVYSRGVSVGSNDGASGYYYVSMQEDGLPVTNATFGNYGPDYFLRTDATLGKLEAVRGGTASILGNNAPGGIFNYVSKTGGDKFAGEVVSKFGLEGDGRNPYYRLDMNIGGPLNDDKSLTYNVGGFYRQSDGARYPGYPMNNGGQLKGNLVKTYDGGSVKLYVKYLNDKNAWFEFLPTIGFTDPKLPASINQQTSVLIPSVQESFTVNQTGEKKQYDSRDKIHSTDQSIGINWEHKLGDGWSLDAKTRYSNKSAIWNTTAVAYPFATDNFLFYAISGNLGKFGTYTFADKATGKVVGKIGQDFNPATPWFPFAFSVKESNFPGADIQKNSVLFNPLFFTENNMKESISQVTVTKKMDNMSFTGGLFYANSQLDRLFSTGVGVAYTQLTSPQPSLTNISFVGAFDGKTYQVSNANGVAGGSNRSAAVNIQTANQGQFALFFGHNWAINPKLNFDWGVRYESVTYKGENKIATTKADTLGGTDKNLLTLYDNDGGEILPANIYTYSDKKVNTFSFSAGLNYLLAENQAVYARYSQGNKAPDLDIFLSINTKFDATNLKPLAQTVQQFEIGYKVKTGNTNLFITPFYSVLSNVPQQVTGTETADLSTAYSTPVLYNKYTTKGIEVEAQHAFTKEFSIRAVATFQSSVATEFKTWLLRNNGRADDTTTSYSGNETDNNARVILRISPAYNTGKFYTSLDISYMGSRAANVANAFYLPAYNQTNLNLGYNVDKNWQVQANINNIFNQDGIMGWSAPGGFPAALDRQGFTKAMLAANPTAVYSTLSLPPRAYFLTVRYKF